MKVGVKMSKSKVPEDFIFHVEDDHLKWLIQKTWERLPACDRAVLRELVVDLSIMDLSNSNGLGRTFPGDPDHIYNGNAGDIAKQESNIIEIDKSMLEGKSDDVCIFVIAHEFAHVVLRHFQINLAIGYLLGFEGPPLYPDQDQKRIRELHDEEANLLAWTWGFDKEMRAFLKEYTGASIPRWFVEIEEP